MVDWLAAHVAELPEDDLTWVPRPARSPLQATRAGSVRRRAAARMHPLVVMLCDERVLMDCLAESAHRCGIVERLLRRIELEGALIAKLIAAILNDPDLAMRPEQKAKFSTVVPRHLRAIDGEAAA